MYLHILALIFTNVLCQTDISSDVLLIREKDSVTCALQGNALSEAFDVTVPFCTSKTCSPESDLTVKYQAPEQSKDTNWGCDFEPGSSCNEQWKNNYVYISKSINIPFRAVTDERWEKFKTFSTNNPKPNYINRIQIDHPYKFYLSVSVRTAAQAEIFLCNNNAADPRAGASCYWILMEAFKSKKEYAIRKCEEGIPDSYHYYTDECSMKRSYIVLPQRLLNTDKWTHYTIIKEASTIMLKNLDDPYPILNFTDTKNIITPKVIFFRNFDYYNVQWRIHDYRFLTFYKPDLYIPLGPEHDFNGHVCISLYFLMCRTCTLNILIQGQKATTVLLKPSENGLLSWQHARIEENIPGSVLIYAYGNGGDFWAVDDVRQCYKDEVRYVSKKVTKPKIICQSLSDFKVQEITANIEPNMICANKSYIGPNCNVMCPHLTKLSYCDAELICQQDRSVTKCYCAPGYGGSYCDIPCDAQTFGYSCAEKCGICKNYCHHIDGYCVDGCEDDSFEKPRCLTNEYPLLSVAPTISKVGHTSVALEFRSKDITGRKPALTYEIQYQELSKNLWESYGNKYALNEFNQIVITGLKTLTPYKFRIILFTKNANSYSGDSVKAAHAVTTCEEDRKFTVTTVSRSAIIMLNNNTESCPFDMYQLTIKIDNNIVVQNFTNVNTYLYGLLPHRKYSVNLVYISTRKLVYTEDIETQQEAPEAIRNLRVTSQGSSTLVFEWDDPLETNGVITGYLVRYSQVQYLACAKNITNEKLSVVARINERKCELQALLPYSRYELVVAAETIATGTETSKEADTLSLEYIEETELPNDFMVDVYPAYVSVSLMEINCTKRKGPLIYQTEAVCLNATWCTTNVSRNLSMGSYSDKLFVFLSNLIPFTNYSIALTALRNDVYLKHENIHYIQTAPKVPPMVNNLTVYSKEKDSFSLRWKLPYPPYGLIEKYRVSCSDYPWCKKQEFSANRICEIYDGFICFKLSVPAHENNPFKIFVQAKNQGTDFGEAAIISVKTGQEKPSPPQNLTFEWKDKILHLRWNHPDIENGMIKEFPIELIINDSDIEKLDHKQFNFSFKIDKAMKYYECMVNETYHFSSSYLVNVRAKNEYTGEAVSISIDTPPELPSLTEETIDHVTNTTNTTISFVIPSVTPNRKSKKCYIFVIVEEISSENGRYFTDMDPEQKINSVLFSKDTMEPHIWAAAVLEAPSDPIRFVLGDGSLTQLKADNLQYKNRQLEPNTQYDVAVAVVNKYKTANATKIYYLPPLKTKGTIVDESNYALLALLVLFAIIPLVWFLYKYKLKNNIFREGIIQNMNRRTAAEINHEPDVIPLTGPSTSKSIPKSTPAGSQKKMVQANKEETKEITAVETSLYHSRLIPFVKFEEYVKQCLNNTEFRDQHGLFPKGGTKPWNYGMMKANKLKNRYNNLAAYDHNRVKLQKLPGDEYSDYINASYINGYKQTKGYIATQGPKTTTLNDFWRMVWQEKVQDIIMVANVIEGGKKKCEQYWPNLEESEQYGDIIVTHQNSDIYADYVFRFFEVSKGKEKMQVQQLHFTSWPDHGVPLYPQSLVSFLKKILTIPQGTSPIIVHCSAGVGRTGTIILCDICLRMAAREGAIDVLRFLHELRDQRANMVDNVDQYKLVHLVLLECLFTPDTNIPCDRNFSQAINKLIEEGGIQRQMNFLKSNAWQEQALAVKPTENIEPENEKKNRFNNIVPVEGRIYISRVPPTDLHSNYINAVSVDGFRFKDQFIVTQNPLPNTLGDFWRMVKEKNIKVIVSLNQIPTDDKSCKQFWPDESSQFEVMRNMTLKHNKIDDSSSLYDVHNIVLLHSTDQECEKMYVDIIQFKHWPRGKHLPNDSGALIHLWSEAENLSRNNHPMLITCYDGATASGVFVAVSFIVEKIKLEQSCDVCLAVRVIRRNRSQFITNKKQFEFLYHSAMSYLDMFETYSNFNAFVKK